MGTARSTCSWAGTPPTSPTGSVAIPVCRSSAGTGPAATPTVPETAHPTLCRSPTGGIFGTTCAGTWNDWLPRITCLPEPTAPVVDHAEDESVDVSLLRWPDSVRVANTRRRYQQVDDLREQGLPM